MTITPHEEPVEGSRSAGETLRSSMLATYDLADHEAALLVEVARTVDVLDVLQAAVDRDGMVLEGGRIHPAVQEARAARLVLTRLLASLRIPEEQEDGTDVRPQRRSGARGAYRPRVIS